jgi:hypothetical protein
MRPTVSTVRPAAIAQAAVRPLERPLLRLALTAGASSLWIGGYVLVTARALQLV